MAATHQCKVCAQESDTGMVLIECHEERWFCMSCIFNIYDQGGRTCSLRRCSEQGRVPYPFPEEWFTPEATHAEPEVSMPTNLIASETLNNPLSYVELDEISDEEVVDNAAPADSFEDFEMDEISPAHSPISDVEFDGASPVSHVEEQNLAFQCDDDLPTTYKCIICNEFGVHNMLKPCISCNYHVHMEPCYRVNRVGHTSVSCLECTNDLPWPVPKSQYINYDESRLLDVERYGEELWNGKFRCWCKMLDETKWNIQLSCKHYWHLTCLKDFFTVDDNGTKVRCAHCNTNTGLASLHVIIREYNRERDRLHMEMLVASIRREKKRKLDQLELEDISDDDTPSPPKRICKAGVIRSTVQQTESNTLEQANAPTLLETQPSGLQQTQPSSVQLTPPISVENSNNSTVQTVTFYHHVQVNIWLNELLKNCILFVFRVMKKQLDGRRSMKKAALVRINLMH